MLQQTGFGSHFGSRERLRKKRDRGLVQKPSSRPDYLLARPAAATVAPVTVRCAVVPIAGLGTRMLPATRAVPKALLPLVDRPVVELVIEELTAAGMEHFVLVAGRGAPAVRTHFQDDRAVEVVVQPEPLGLGDAVARGAGVVDGPIAVAVGDALVEGTATRRLIEGFERSGAAVAMAVEAVAPERVGRYGIVAPAGVGDPIPVAGIVEKPMPAVAPSNLAVAGRWVLSAEAAQSLASTPPDHGGEVQLTDAIARLCEDGARVVAVALQPGERRLDLGDPEGYASAFVERALADPRFGERLRAGLRADVAPR
jgi:UTP--glucose-1-phosphate uridylyltransferase